MLIKMNLPETKPFCLLLLCCLVPHGLQTLGYSQYIHGHRKPAVWEKLEKNYYSGDIKLINESSEDVKFCYIYIYIHTHI